MMLPGEELRDSSGAGGGTVAPPVRRRRRYRQFGRALETLATAIVAWWVWLNWGTGWVLVLGMVLVVRRNVLLWQYDRAWAEALRAARDRRVVLTAMPPLSVLVAAWNEAQTIAEHIQSFRQLSYADRELLLCAGGEDGTYQAACEHAGGDVMVLEQLPGEGKRGALQRCWERARGELIYLTDADCLMTDDAVLRTVAPLVEEDEHVSTGTCEPRRSQRGRPFVTYQWCVDLYQAAERGKYERAILGANCCVRRQALEAVGGFEMDTRIGEDYVLSMRLRRAGYRIRYVPDSSIETDFSDTFLQHSRRKSRWMRTTYLLGKEYREQSHVSNVLGTWASSLGGLFLLLCAVVFRGMALGTLLLLAAHGLARRLRFLRFGNLLGVTVTYMTIVQLPLFLLVDWLSAVRGLVEVSVPSLRWRW